jgi:hypothetical protein
VRVLLRATPTATQDLHFKGQIRKTHDSYFWVPRKSLPILMS